MLKMTSLLGRLLERPEQCTDHFDGIHIACRLSEYPRHQTIASAYTPRPRSLAQLKPLFLLTRSSLPICLTLSPPLSAHDFVISTTCR